MDSKDKAKELVDKMFHSTYAHWEWEECREVAKQCALIAQNNLIDKLQTLGIIDSFENDVLIEIELL